MPKCTVSLFFTSVTFWWSKTLCFVIFCMWKGNKDGNGWEWETGSAERQETLLLITELKELWVSLIDPHSICWKSKKGFAYLDGEWRMGEEGYFNYYTNQRSGLWLWFFSQVIPQVFSFSKFNIFMISLISSFHLLIWVFWVTFLLNF